MQAMTDLLDIFNVNIDLLIKSWNFNEAFEMYFVFLYFTNFTQSF